MLPDRVEIFLGQYTLPSEEAEWIKEMVAIHNPKRIFVVADEIDKWPARFGEHFFKELSPQVQLGGYQSFLRATRQAGNSTDAELKNR